MWVLFWRCFLCKIMLMKFGFKCSEKLPRMRIKHNSALFVRAFNANVDLHSNSEMLHIPINWYRFSVSYFFEWKNIYIENGAKKLVDGNFFSPNQFLSLTNCSLISTYWICNFFHSSQKNASMKLSFGIMKLAKNVLFFVIWVDKCDSGKHNKGYFNEIAARNLSSSDRTHQNSVRLPLGTIEDCQWNGCVWQRNQKLTSKWQRMKGQKSIII